MSNRMRIALLVAGPLTMIVGILLFLAVCVVPKLHP